METSGVALATESFSLGWLSNKELISYNERAADHNFTFDIPIAKFSTDPLVFHTDEIFPASSLASNTPVSLNSSQGNTKPGDLFLAKWKKSSKMIVRELIKLFLKPRRRSKARVESWSDSNIQSSPLQSLHRDSKDVLLDFDSSISEAVLHCKRSLGM